ncbi:hypothetical protein Syn7502_00757 [Synechococcus sp. PCC 7502]|uniref:DUF760 domain-containing protein n=1 Tax=Synechococcus sp. PCC 7502 TaxID=1173263 RepID=UPI00029FC963|nr:DUF760 domain-containing protein [Synechococcus sp. PCC 7502]AFY72891.1 hypothetical protein Syn7502_00757 [Synechococcus sp. PCC 7502]
MFEIQDTGSNNALLTYLKSQSPEAIELAAKGVSPEIRQIINHNIQGLVGMLPPQQFQVSITTTHENLANLIGSAMMTGYFLSQMETRMKLDSAFGNSFSLSNPEQINEFNEVDKPAAE